MTMTFKAEQDVHRNKAMIECL